MFCAISLARGRTEAGDEDRKKWGRRWRAPQHGNAAQGRFGSPDPRNQVRAGGAPKGPQTHVNVLKELIGQEGDRAGDDDRKKWGNQRSGRQRCQTAAGGGTVPPPPKKGACWGCSKEATNACECFERFHWPGGGPRRATRTARNGGTNGRAASAAKQPPAEVRCPHPPKMVRAGGAPKGPQTHVNVLSDFIGQVADRGGRRGPQEMGAPKVGPPVLPNSRPRRYGAPTPQKWCVLGVLQRGHKRM